MFLQDFDNFVFRSIRFNRVKKILHKFPSKNSFGFILKSADVEILIAGKKFVNGFGVCIPGYINGILHTCILEYKNKKTPEFLPEKNI